MPHNIKQKPVVDKTARLTKTWRYGAVVVTVSRRRYTQSSWRGSESWYTWDISVSPRGSNTLLEHYDNVERMQAERLLALWRNHGDTLLKEIRSRRRPMRVLSDFYDEEYAQYYA